jgi:hypothetical protein
MAPRPRTYLTVERAVLVRRAGERARTPIVLDFDGHRFALTPEQAAELQLQIAAALVRQRRAD